MHKSKFIISLLALGIFFTAQAMAETEIDDVPNCYKVIHKVGARCYVNKDGKDFIWSLVARTKKFLNSIEVWKDETSDLVIGDRPYGNYSQYFAQNFCSSRDSLEYRGNGTGELKSKVFGLPSGYPRHWNGKYGFPDKDSDLVMLESHGIQQVMGMRFERVWSDSLFPGRTDIAFYFDPAEGNVDYIEREKRYYSFYGDGSYTVHCVGR